MTWEQCCEKFGTLPKFRDLMKDLPSVKSAEDMAEVLDDRGATFQVGKAFDHFFQVKRDSVFISETSLLKKMAAKVMPKNCKSMPKVFFPSFVIDTETGLGKMSWETYYAFLGSTDQEQLTGSLVSNYGVRMNEVVYDGEGRYTGHLDNLTKAQMNSFVEDTGADHGFFSSQLETLDNFLERKGVKKPTPTVLPRSSPHSRPSALRSSPASRMMSSDGEDVDMEGGAESDGPPGRFSDDGEGGEGGEEGGEDDEPVAADAEGEEEVDDGKTVAGGSTATKRRRCSSASFDEESCCTGDGDPDDHLAGCSFYLHYIYYTLVSTTKF